MKQYISDIKDRANDIDLCLCNAYVVRFNINSHNECPELMSDLNDCVGMLYTDNVPVIVLCTGLVANYLTLKYNDKIKGSCCWEDFVCNYFRDSHTLHASSERSMHRYLYSCIEYAMTKMKPLDISVKKKSTMEEECCKPLPEREYFDPGIRFP